MDEEGLEIVLPINFFSRNVEEGKRLLERGILLVIVLNYYQQIVNEQIAIVDERITNLRVR